MDEVKNLDCSSIQKELDKLAITLNNIIFIDTPFDTPKTDASEELSEKRHRLSRIFMTFYQNSLKENFLWQFCPYDVYVSHFDQRKSVFLQDNQYGTINDFCIKEIKNLSERYDQNQLHLTPQMVYKSFFSNSEHQLQLSFYLSTKDYQNVYFSQRKKLEFLRKLMNDEQTPSNQDFFLDFSDSSEAEKIVFLNELGILEFLRKSEPFNMSTNKLAEVISGFTGIKQTTAQSYLNPMFSDYVDQSKSALKPKTLKSVNEKLIKIGYFSKKISPLQST